MKYLRLSVATCCVLLVSAYAVEYCFDEMICCVGQEEDMVWGNPYNFGGFYRCRSEVAIAFDCINPGKPCFNNGTGYCDTMANVPHCSAGGITTTTTTTTTTPAPEPINCRPDVVHNVPVQGDCSKYMICVFGEPLPDVYDCADELRFDSFPTVENCNVQDEVQCDPPICNATGEYNVRHSKVCHRFWTCTEGALSGDECPAGQHFDPTDLVCKAEADAGCHDSNVCPDGEGTVFVPHDDCTKYWLCVNGTPYEQDCQSGLFFDCVELKCMGDVDPVVCGCTKPPPHSFWTN